jgi:hypothetical protein
MDGPELASYRVGMTSPLRRMAIVFGLALVILVILAGAATAVGLMTRTRAEQHHAYDLPGSRLVLDANNGSIRIAPGQPGRVEVDAHLHYSRLSRAKPTARLEGDRLILRDGCRTFLSFFCDVTYDLRVPATVALQAHSGNGDVRVSGITGDLDLRTSNGAISSDGAPAQLRLRTSNGAITATGLHASAVDARTSNGTVRLSFVEAPRQVTARSSNGDISIAVPRQGGPYRVDAQTSNGKRTIDVPTDPAASSTITARTSNGDLTLSRAG